MLQSFRMEQSHKRSSDNVVTIASVALFILAAFGVIVFLYNQNQSLKEKLAVYEQSQTTPTPTTIIVPQESSSPSASPKSTTIPKVSTDSAAIR